MKKYSNLFVCCRLFLFLFSILFVGCKEDDTLEGAKEIYITISPKDPFIMVGDTVLLSAEVSNLNGDIISAPIEWKSDDEKIVKIYEGKMIAQDGGQGKTTKVRAMLQNGKYALTNVTVTTHAVNGVAPFEEIHYAYSSTKANDTIWFAVDPIELLIDYTPKFKNSDPEFLPPTANPIYIDKESGKVGYAFNPGNITGKATITILIGPDGNEKSGSTEVVISPLIVPTLGTDFNSITYEFSTIMDINSIDTVWVNTKVDPTYAIDLSNAEQLYKWGEVDGNTAQLFDVGVKVTTSGHRAYAILRSGKFTGQNVLKFKCNGIELTITVDVQNFVTQYPVDVLSVDKTSLETFVGSTVYVTPTVLPVSSYGIHLPKFTPKDPSIIEVIGYNGNEMGMKALKQGETDVVVTSNDKSVTIRVKVSENIQSVILRPNNVSSIFEGQTTQWFADVITSGGSEIKPTWQSADNSVASVDAEGLIAGHKAGSVSITAEAGGVLSAPGKLKVVGIPTGTLTYDQSNTNLDGNAALMENGNILIVLEPLTAAPFKEVYLIVKPNTPASEVVNATYSPSNASLSLKGDGAETAITSGTIFIQNGDDSWSKRVTADVTVTAGSKTFNLIVVDLLVYI